MMALPAVFFWCASMTGVKMLMRSSGMVKVSTVRISGNDWKPYSVMKRGLCFS